MKKYILIMPAILVLLFAISCKDYLDVKPDKKLSTLSTLADLQSILDHSLQNNNNTLTSAGEIACDDHYVTDVHLAAITSETDRRIYNWEKSNLFPETVNSWFDIYRALYIGNSVLDNIVNIDRTSANNLEWDNVKGQGYFYKGFFLLNGAMIWAPAYDPATAASDLGMPIRESTDFNIKSTRASVAATYAQIISDLQHAAALLPISQVSVTRPTKIAAYATLSRVYLIMNKYKEAGIYADSALQLNNKLLDYNTFSKTAALSFPEFTVETLFSANFSETILNTANLKMADELYQQYDANDLRKGLFFTSNGNGTYAFKGSYSGSTRFAHAPAVDEMYLNRAESYARQNRLTEALADLNALMVTRWDKTKVYPKYASTNATQVIDWILKERRKELVNRGLRWGDLKRLNKLGSNITLKRSYNAGQQVLEPNSSRYAMALPEDIIELTGMPQNP